MKQPSALDAMLARYATPTVAPQAVQPTPTTVGEDKAMELFGVSAHKTAELSGLNWDTMTPQAKADFRRQQDKNAFARNINQEGFAQYYPEDAANYEAYRTAPFVPFTPVQQAAPVASTAPQSQPQFQLSKYVDEARAIERGVEEGKGITAADHLTAAEAGAESTGSSLASMGATLQRLAIQSLFEPRHAKQVSRVTSAPTYLDEASKSMSEAAKETRTEFSPAAQKANRELAVDQAVSEKKVAAYIQERIKAGDSPTTAMAKGQAYASMLSVGDMAANPGATSLKVSEAAPSLAGTAVATAVGGPVGGMLFNAASEGGSTMVGIREEIAALTPEQLHAAPAYQELKKANPNITDAQAKALLATQLGDTAGLVSGGIAAIIGNLTGADKAAGNLITGAATKGLLDTGKKIIKSGGVEALEESLQGATGQVAQNIAMQDIDPNRSVLKDVGKAVGEGAVVGALLSGGATTARSSGDIVKGAVSPVTKKMKAASEASAKKREEAARVKAEAAAQQANEVATATPEQAEEIISNMDMSEITATTDAIISEFNAATSEEDKQAGAAKINAVARNYFNVVDTLSDQYDAAREEAIALSADGKAEAASAKNAEADAIRAQRDALEMEADKLMIPYQDYTSSLSDTDVQAIRDTSAKISEGTATPEELSSTASAILNLSKTSGSPLVLSQLAAPAQAILNSPDANLDATTRKQLEDFVALQELMASPASQQTRAGKTTGAQGFVGANQYYQQLQSAIASGDKAGAQQVLDKMGRFANYSSDRAKAIQEAQVQANKTRTAVPVEGVYQKDGTTEYVVYPGKASDERTQNIVDESAYLNQATELMTTAFQNAFGETAVASPEATVSDEAVIDTNVPPSAPEAATASPAQPKTKAKRKKKEKKAEPTVEAAPAEPVPPVEDYADIPTGMDADEYIDYEQAMRDVEPTPAIVTQSEEATSDVVASADTSVDTTTQSPAESSESDINPAMVDIDAVQEEADESAKATQILNDIDDIEAPVGNKNFDSKSDVDKKFLTTNQVKEHYSAVNTGSPFQSVSNFWEVLKGTGVKAFLDKYTGADVSQAEVDSAVAMAEFRDLFVAKFNYILKPMKGTDSIYRHGKPLNYFRTADGDIHPAIVDSMAIAAYQWLVTHGRSTMTNDEQQIKYILDVDSKSAIDPVLTASLRDVGTSLAPLVKQWGANTLITAGLSPDSSIGEVEASAINQALGLAVANTLRSMDILDKTTTISNDDLTRMAGNEVVKPSKATTTFVRMKDNEGLVNSVTAAEKGRKVIPFLMESSGSNNKDANLGKPHKNPVGKNIKRSYQKIAKDIRKAVQRYANVPMYLDAPWVEFLSLAGGDGFIASMMGRQDTDGMHKSNALSVESSNLSIERSIERYNNFRTQVDTFIESENYDALSESEKALGVPTYFKYEVSTNNRVYTVSETVNPQNDKLHRSVLVYEDNQYTFNPQMGNVTIGDTGLSANDLFKITFAQSMGESTDNILTEKSIAAADAMLADSTIRDGINAVKEMLTSGEPATGAQQQSILAAIKKGKEKAQSGKAIFSMAQFEMALDNGDTEFSSTLLYEVDGKANGPFNTLMHLGLTADKDTVLKHMAQGGFIVGYDSYAEWKQNPLNLDSYQTTAVGAEQRIRNQSSADIAIADGVKAIIGSIAIDTSPNGDGTVLESTKDGRKLGKTVNVPSGYGAGEQSIYDNITNMYISGVYSTLESALAERTRTGDSSGLTALRASIRTVLGNPTWNFPKTKKSPLEWEFTSKEKAKISESINRTVGQHAYDAMATEYKESEHSGALMGAMDNVVTQTFSILFNNAVTERITQERAAGTLSSYSSLSTGQMKEVFDSLIAKAPVYRGFFNKPGQFEEYISTLKWETSENAPNAVGNARTESAVKADVDGSEGLGSAVNYSMSVASAGVRSRPLMVIGNGDAATMALQDTNSDIQTLNIFDARMSTPLQMGTVGAELNKANVDIINGFNIMESMVETFSRVLGDAITLSEDKGNKELNKAIRNLGSKLGYSPAALKNMSDATILNEAAKYITQRKDFLIANRNEVMAMPMTTSQFISPGSASQINPQTEEQVVADVAEALTEEATPENSQVDMLPTTSGLEHNFLEGNITTAEDLISVIDAHAQSAASSTTNPEHKAFYEGMSSLIGMLNKAVAGTQVVYVGTQTMLDQLSEKSPDTNWSNTRGLWSATDLISGDATPTIYLKGSGLVNHGMNMATATHELIHAATASVVEQYQSDKSKLPASTQKAVADLLKLRDDMLKSEVFQKVAPAEAIHQIRLDTKGHEFIAWGLSNQRIMNALSQTQGKLKGAMTKFLASIARMFGGNSKQVSALTQLASITANISEFRATQLGDKTVDPDLRLAQASKAAANHLNMVGMLKALIDADNKELSDEHSVHLTSLIDNIGNSFGDSMVSRQVQSTGNLDADAMSMVAELGGGTTQTNPRGMGVPMTASEEYAFSVVYTLLQHGIGAVNNASKDLHRMYEVARTQVPVETFMANPSLVKTDPQYAIQYAAAQVAFDSIFNPTAQKETTKSLDYLQDTMTTRTNDYLVNFGALALTNETFRNALEDVINPRAKVRTDRGIVARIQDIFDAIIQWFTDSYSAARGNAAVSSRVHSAAYALTVQQSKKRSVMETKFNEGVSYVGGRLNAGVTASAKALGNKIADSTTSSTKSSIRVAGKVIAHYATSPAKVGNIVDSINATVKSQATGKLNAIQKLIEEAKVTGDTNAMFRKFLTLTNKNVEKDAQTIRTSVTKAMKNAFSKRLTKEQDSALYYAALKTDLSALLDYGYSLDDINALLANPAALSKKIADTKARIRGVEGANPFTRYYNNMSELLGYYMATGIVGDSGLLMNPELIARRVTPGYVQATDSVTADVKPVIDELATLYALRHTSLNHRTELSNLFTQELNRTDEQGNATDNGISAFLKTHSKSKVESLKRIFNGSETLAVKGYTKDTFSPFVNITFADGSDTTMEVMRKQGYKKGKSIGVDKNDPDKVERFIYQSDEGGNVTFTQGAISISNRTAKGSQSELGGKTANSVTQSKAADFKRLNTSDMAIRPGTHMAAINDIDGNIVGWRYLMSDVNKESILQKSTQGVQALSNVIASTNTKAVSVELNKSIVEATHDQYKKDVKAGKGGQYIMVSKSSADPEIKALARRIPEETWKVIDDLYGKEVFPVRNDQQDTLLGYEDMTITNLFSEEAQLSKFNRALVGAVNLVTGDQARSMTYARRGERGLQELASFARRNIVLLSPGVLIGNMLSNTTQLMLKGVPFTEAFRLQVEGWRAGAQYRNDAAKVAVLKVEMAATEDAAKAKQLQSQITRLENRMATNPAAQLAEEGFLISISEDISMDDTVKQYEYAGQISAAVSKVIDVLPSPIANTIHEFTSDGRMGMGAVIAGATQMSDFASRYALVKHQVSNEGKTMAQAILDAQNQFINYDLPTGRLLSYMNKMGVLWFHRYYVRIQHVLMGIAKENPAGVIAVSATNMATNVDLASPFNSSVLVQSPFSHLGGPERLVDGVLAHPVINTLEAVF